MNVEDVDLVGVVVHVGDRGGRAVNGDRMGARRHDRRLEAQHAGAEVGVAAHLPRYRLDAAQLTGQRVVARDRPLGLVGGRQPQMVSGLGRHSRHGVGQSLGCCGRPANLLRSEPLVLIPSPFPAWRACSSALVCSEGSGRNIDPGSGDPAEPS